MSVTKNCYDKIPFMTRSEAEGAKVTAQYNYKTVKLKTYRCSKCEMWHIASVQNDDEDWD